MTPIEKADFDEMIALLADLAANLPEFGGCKRPLKRGDAFKIRQRLDAMTAIKDELVKSLEAVCRSEDTDDHWIEIDGTKQVLAEAKEVK